MNLICSFRVLRSSPQIFSGGEYYMLQYRLSLSLTVHQNFRLKIKLNKGDLRNNYTQKKISYVSVVITQIDRVFYAMEISIRWLQQAGLFMTKASTARVTSKIICVGIGSCQKGVRFLLIWFNPGISNFARLGYSGNNDTNQKQFGKGPGKTIIQQDLRRINSCP